MAIGPFAVVAAVAAAQPPAGVARESRPVDLAIAHEDVPAAAVIRLDDAVACQHIVGNGVGVVALPKCLRNGQVGCGMGDELLGGQLVGPLWKPRIEIVDLPPQEPLVIVARQARPWPATHAAPVAAHQVRMTDVGGDVEQREQERETGARAVRVQARAAGFAFDSVVDDQSPRCRITVIYYP